MTQKRRSFRVLALLAVIAAAPAPALAWGGAGHRMLGEAAALSVPAELPAFLRSPGGVAAIGELSREPDRSKGAGKGHDVNRDAAHFIDLDDAQRVHGGPLISELPVTRPEYEKLMQAAGVDSWKGGYLPYAIADQAQQLAKDFAHWRAETYAIPRQKDRARRAWLQADRARREAQILQTIGYLSHFVGDGAQPLHTSVHYNGWGPFPNPAGYSQDKVHGPFEGDLVVRSASTAKVVAAMIPARSCAATLESCVASYLAETNAQVIPFYELVKSGGLAAGDPRGPAFALGRLGAGASELRDLIVWSWGASDNLAVGWTPVPLRDILSGKVDPYRCLYGID